MKNNKGFTLTELLVVVVILGIITGISIPLIRGLSASLERKKYTNYADSVLSASKLYNDSYSEDLFGHKEYGCAYIKYDDLVERNLLKDIQITDISCNSENTYVRVIKQKDKYGYANYLSCGKKVNGKADNVTTSIPTVIPTIDETSCSGVEDNNLLISADEAQIGNVFDKKRKKTKLTITSGTGINNNVVIYTKWSTNRNDYSDAGFSRTTFKVKGNQEKDLLNGNLISTTSSELLTPEGESGAYYLIVRVDNLFDLYGSRWKNPDKTDNKYVSFGPFSIDNIKPVISEFNITSTNNSYNHLKANVKVTSTDNLTPTNKLKMCISEDNNKCKNANEFVAYNANTQHTFSGSYNGNERTLYISVKDLAGNVQKTSKKYRSAIKNTITYNSNGGSSCANKDVYYNYGTTTTWGSLCTPTRTGYTFGGWYTNSNGTGTNITNSSKVSGNITVYAKWNLNKVNIKINSNGGVLASTHGAGYTVTNNVVKNNNSDIIHSINYGGSIGTSGLVNYNNPSYLNLYRTGYTPVSYNTKADGTGTSFNQDDNYAASKFCNASNGSCTVTLYVIWRLNKCTITFDPNGGSFTSNANNRVQALNYGSSNGDFWNASGGFFSATRSGYYIDPATAWVNGNTTYNQNAGYSATQVCPNLANGDQNVTLRVNWRANLECPHFENWLDTGANYIMGTWTNHNIYFRATFGSNVTKFHLYTNHGSSNDWQDFGEKTPDGNRQYTDNLTSEGSRKVKMILYGVGGATKTCQWDNFNIDKTPPEQVDFIYTGGGLIQIGDDRYNPETTFTFFCNDSLSGLYPESVSIRYRDNGNGTGARDGYAITWTPPVGNYIIDETCIDRAGNVATNGWSYRIVQPSSGGGGSSGGGSSGGGSSGGGSTCRPKYIRRSDSDIMHTCGNTCGVNSFKCIPSSAMQSGSGSSCRCYCIRGC